MSESSNPDEEPKIVVDTDWKEQVAKEREQQEQQDASQADTIEDISDFVAKEPDAADDTSEREQAGDLPPPPPATFDVLVSLLFTQAMGTLGHVPHPATGKSEINKPYAKHYIDTLDMLGEKTKGNLSDDETKILSETLHALRMAYVNAKN